MTLPNESGYFNQFDPSDNYYDVRFRSGYVLQSREMNELQAILKQISKSNWNTIYRNGSLVTGGQFSADPSNPNLINVSSGEVYYEGVVHTVPGSQVTLTGVGTETIGVLFTESIVDYVADSDLRDPAAGYQNFGMPGASRHKILKQWVNSTSNANAIPVFTFEGGKLAKLPEKGSIDIINQTLARRTYDESGNYTVNGFDVSLAAKDTGQFYAVIGNTSTTGTGSKAYVQGREIVKLLPERIALDKAFDTRFFDLDQVVYNGTDNVMRLAEDRIKNIVKVSAEFRINNKAVTKGGVGGQDTFINAGESLREIYAVKNTSGGSTAYTSGTDYLKTGNTINWSPAGSEPAVGATYYVDYRYKRDLLASEYTLTVDPDTGASYIDITNCSPKPESTFGIDVSYNFYLARVDVIYIKPDGNIDVAQGNSEKSAVAKPVPVGMLGLCEVFIPAGGDHNSSKVTVYDTKRFTMEEFHRILTRLERAEYNQAVQQLDGTAQQYAAANVATLSGILTEGFTYTAEDVNTDGQGGISRIKFDKALTSKRMIDITSQELVLPEVQTTTNLSVLDSSTTTKKFTHITSMATASETNSLIAQPLATDAITLNQYGTSSRAPFIVIASSIDNELETDAVITANNSLAAVSPLYQTRDQFPYGNVSSDIDRNLRQYNNTMKTFIKSGKTVHVRGFGYPANSYLQASFDNNPVALTAVTSSSGLPAGITLPSGGNTLASTDGRIQCNADGEFLATFNTPLGVPSGVRGVVVSDSAGNSATATFDGRGLQKVQLENSIRKQAELRDPPAPKILTFNASSTNVTSGNASTLSGNFTGLATSVVLRTSNGTSTKTALSATATSYSVSTGNLTAGIEYALYLEGPGGISEAQEGTIQVGSVGPSGVAPTNTLYRAQVDNSVNGVSRVTIDWSYSGTVDKVTLSFSNTQFVVKTAGANLANLASSGQVVLDVYQPGTFTMIASGSGGNADIKTTQVNVTRDVPVRASVVRDPMAQIFTMKKPALVTEVEVFFKAKSSTVPVTLEIRDVVDGLPGQKVLAYKMLEPGLVNISNDASSGTRFIFEDAAWLDIDTSFGFKQYCFVVASDSPSYQIWAAKIGSTTVGTVNQAVQAQPYVDGLMLTSSNTVWSTISDTDIKFTIKNASFNQSATNVLSFSSVTTSACTGMFLKIDVLNQDSSNSINWQYKLNNAGDWINFTPGTYIDFKVQATQIDIRATLAGSSTTSPVIDHSTATLKMLFRQSSGEYITKRATFAQAYNDVRLVTRAYAPNLTSVRVFFTDETSGAGPGSFAWTEITSGWTSTTLPDGKYIEKDNNPGYSLSTNSNRKFFRIRIRLETTDITVTPRLKSVMGIVNN